MRKNYADVEVYLSRHNKFDCHLIFKLHAYRMDNLRCISLKSGIPDILNKKKNNNDIY